jgi:hypothetical protein
VLGPTGIPAARGNGEPGEFRTSSAGMLTGYSNGGLSHGLYEKLRSCFQSFEVGTVFQSSRGSLVCQELTATEKTNVMRAQRAVN